MDIWEKWNCSKSVKNISGFLWHFEEYGFRDSISKSQFTWSDRIGFWRDKNRLKEENLLFRTVFVPSKSDIKLWLSYDDFEMGPQNPKLEKKSKFTNIFSRFWTIKIFSNIRNFPKFSIVRNRNMPIWTIENSNPPTIHIMRRNNAIWEVILNLDFVSNM